MKIPLNAALAVGILAVCGYVYWAATSGRPEISTAVFATAASTPGIDPAATITVPVATVQVLPKAKTVKKLKLPEDVATDSRQQILTAVDVPPAPAGATAVTILDIDSGRSRTLIKAKERPFLSLEAGTEIGARYGVATAGSGQQIDLYARRDLLRIGNAYVALYAEANSRPEARAMLDVSVRW